MNRQLGSFRLLEQIEPGGYTTVYRAEQDLGQDFKRPAAVKVLHALDLSDEQKRAVLRRETEMLLELGSCPNIVTIYGVGIDPEMGPWIAMELLGQSLKRLMGDSPAEPDQVRILLRDTLRALAVVHALEPPILHRDLKPNNILSTDYGNWVVADFGLARRWEADETLHLATVQYAAPELLDTSLGPEAPSMDLYSLGMLAYEYALGRTLYRKQFPSVYDPYAESSAKGDERPKWMYWHTSMQMSAPPIAELIEDYPRDLSDLIAAMMVKPLRERLGSAREALARLGRVEGGAVVLPVAEKEISEERAAGKRRAPALAALAVLVLLIAVAGGIFVLGSGGQPQVQLAELYTGTVPIEVSGTIERFPGGGSAEIVLPNGDAFPVYVDDAGEFHCEVDVEDLGETRGFLKISDKGGNVWRKTVRLERTPPEIVQIALATMPVAPSAEVLITPHGKPDGQVRMQTDQAGIVRAEVPYGRFDLAVSHPRYRPLADSFSTGIDPHKQLTARLDEIPMHEVYAEMRNLIDRVRGLAMRKANCPPGPLSQAESRQLETSLARLQEIYNADPDVELFLDAAKRVEECNAQSFAAVDQAAQAAAAAVEESQLASGPEGAPPTHANGGGRIVAGGGTPAALAALNGGRAGSGLAGDPQVQALIGEIMQRAGASGAVDPAVVATLMNLPLNEFTAFIEKNVPRGALTIEPVARLDKVRLRGVLFNDKELERLVLRLLPAMGRLQLELRVDGWAVCRRLEERLRGLGAEGVRVHAFLAPRDDAIFVQVRRGPSIDREAAQGVAQEFVIDADLLRVQTIPAAKAS